MRLDVSGTSYDSAAEAFTAGNHLAAMYYTSLTGKLGGYGAMAGDDKSSEEFVQGYDDMARETVGASADVVDAFATMASLTATSGQNHRDANAASVYKKPPPMYDGTGLLRGGPVDVAAYTPPSSLGGDNQDMPEFWNLVVDHLQGYAWPSADTGKLRSAAGTWRTMAGNLELLPGKCDTANGELSGQRSPEIPLAQSATKDLKTQVQALATECRTLGDACEDYAEQVEQTRETIKDLIRDLAIEIGATAVVSGALSFVTFGGAAAVGAGVATARAISCARRIIAALAALKAVRAIGTIARTLPKIRGIRTALTKFKNVRAVRSASSRINDRLWTSGRFTGQVKANPKNVKWHYNKHKGEFPELHNSKEYLDRAKQFMSDPPPGTYTRVREPGGDILRYNPDTNTLGIMTKDGVMKTMMKPDPSKHNFPNNWEYFLNG